MPSYGRCSHSCTNQRVQSLLRGQSTNMLKSLQCSNNPSAANPMRRAGLVEAQSVCYRSDLASLPICCAHGRTTAWMVQSLILPLGSRAREFRNYTARAFVAGHVLAAGGGQILHYTHTCFPRPEFELPATGRNLTGCLLRSVASACRSDASAFVVAKDQRGRRPFVRADTRLEFIQSVQVSTRKGPDDRAHKAAYAIAHTGNGTRAQFRA